MGRFIARRLVQAVPTLFGIMLLTFLLTRLSPADPIDFYVGGSTELTAQDRDALRHAYGLDRALPLQFVDFVWGVARLDFGKSFYSHRPAVELIAERIPNSLQLALVALVVALAIGVPLGILAALYRGSRVDHGIRVLSVVLHAIPEFFLALLFVLVLGVQLRWFPIGSMNTIGLDCGFCWDRVAHLAGPVIISATAGIATFPRYLRTEMLEILGQDYVRTARSKGLRERAVIVGHAFRNALIPIVTLFGGILTIVIGGSVVVEQVFTWPGLGRLLFEAANNKDYPVVEAAVVAGSVLLLISYILRDIAYAWVDPRIKVR